MALWTFSFLVLIFKLSPFVSPPFPWLKINSLLIAYTHMHFVRRLRTSRFRSIFRKWIAILRNCRHRDATRWLRSASTHTHFPIYQKNFLIKHIDFVVAYLVSVFTSFPFSSASHLSLSAAIPTVLCAASTFRRLSLFKCHISRMPYGVDGANWTHITYIHVIRFHWKPLNAPNVL